MYRTGHYGAALLAYAPLGFAVTAAGFAELALAGGAGAAALAVLPDHDQRVPGLAHRGPTHTVAFALAVAAVVGAAAGALAWSSGPLAAAGLAAFAFAGAALSLGSHLAADALTPAGVAPFAPVRSTTYSLDVARAANPLANYGLFALGVAAALAALAAGTAVQGAL